MCVASSPTTAAAPSTTPGPIEATSPSCPAWVLQQLQEREPAPSRMAAEAAPHTDALSNRRTYGQAALEGEVARVTNAPHGSQNDTLNYATW